MNAAHVIAAMMTATSDFLAVCRKNGATEEQARKEAILRMPEIEARALEILGTI